MENGTLKDRVLDAVDLLDVIGERVTLQRKGREYIGLCPFHPDHKPSMTVNPAKRIFKCFSCGAGGDVIRFIQLIDRVSFRAALESLAQRAGIDIARSPAERHAAEIREPLLAAIRWAGDHFRQNLRDPQRGQAARDYMRRRGLTDETAETCGLGLTLDAWDDCLAAARRAGLSEEILQQAGLVARNESGRIYDRFRNRLIFPIADTLGRPVAFGGRTLGDDPAKYLNSPETNIFSKSRILYGLDRARHVVSQSRRVIVVEGYMDAVLLQQYGFTDAVATLGTALTDAHVSLLRPLADTLYLCFDSDDAGQRAADRAVEVALQARTDVRVVVLDHDKDPADCVVAGGAAAFQHYLDTACDALEYKWRHTLTAFGNSGDRARRAAIEELLQFVARTSVAGNVDAIQQNLLTGRLSELLGVSPAAAFEMLTAARRQVRRGARAAAANHDRSDYETALRGVPGTLIAPVETLLGLLLTSPATWSNVDDTFTQALPHAQLWSDLYRVLLEVHEDLGEYALGDVQARCDAAAICELIDRAVARTRDVSDPHLEFDTVRERLANELAALTWAPLRARLRSDEQDDDAFTALRQRFKDASSALPVESRVSLPGT